MTDDILIIEAKRHELYKSKEVFTTGEVAKIIGLCSNTVARMCAKGHLKHYVSEKKRFIPKAALREFLMVQNGITIDPHQEVLGETKELVSSVRLLLLELRRRPDFNMESIADVIPR